MRRIHMTKDGHEFSRLAYGTWRLLATEPSAQEINRRVNVCLELGITAIDTAERCGVKHLALIHHDPVRTDDELDRLAAGLGGVRPTSGLQVSFAAEGLTIEL